MMSSSTFTSCQQEILNLDSFCNRLGLTSKIKATLAPRWAELTSTWNGALPDYVTIDYLEKACVLSRVPQHNEVLQRIKEVLALADSEPAVALYLHILYTGNFLLTPNLPIGDFTPVPLLRDNEGILNLIVALGVYPLALQKYRTMGIPDFYADELMKWIGGTVKIYQAAHHGIPGHTLSQTFWMRYYPAGILFRIGRLEAQIQTAPDWLPPIYRHSTTGQIQVLCKDKTRLTNDGLCSIINAPYAMETCLIEDKTSITGTPVDNRGRADLTRTITLNKNEWLPVYTPWDIVPTLHIPGGEPLLLEDFQSSTKEIIKFIEKYLKRHPPLLACDSWILNPAWQELLPNGNMAKLQKNTYQTIAPPSNERDGMFFVFGRDDVPPTALPAENHIQQAMQQAYLNYNGLRLGAMFVLT